MRGWHTEHKKGDMGARSRHAEVVADAASSALWETADLTRLFVAFAILCTAVFCFCRVVQHLRHVARHHHTHRPDSGLSSPLRDKVD